MPFMKEIAHYERVIKMNGAFWKPFLIGEEARINVAHRQSAHLPIQCSQKQTVQSLPVPCNGISQAAALEKCRRFLKRAEEGGRRQRICFVASHFHRNFAI